MSFWTPFGQIERRGKVDVLLNRYNEVIFTLAPWSLAGSDYRGNYLAVGKQVEPLARNGQDEIPIVHFGEGGVITDFGSVR